MDFIDIKYRIYEESTVAVFSGGGKITRLSVYH